ncbi:hypothetical protein GCM10023184_28260 [Flaviaesturariibacter amylovorans]|uniref:Uncharacterized protein n=1 Tax=Flaviaesturariibacter amylovorans TaxID=1084520 RepID=A0ABP8H4M7_9BACT
MNWRDRCRIDNDRDSRKREIGLHILENFKAGLQWHIEIENDKANLIDIRLDETPEKRRKGKGR